ncbi:uncharacterized protein SPAPADRAFT_148469 [Spathaspora passalidarum NRRL Y-27907]|uniref:Uncharacterized protein n=1 Tax=Spathaspora passalidarum (strain NRRL Y-27907 / 11-Y1) TaxID=619300 RepID=G3AHB7_SPAPN|nr:uncharacterized protein SPAPADRAFT_148469 [Spathaspora passalidarum NRRL Y-27907]EGW34081.1 hypothetical protein SPAPADRAFT_148469 [Spathaspora passalidarum NRRL Y-27907]
MLPKEMTPPTVSAAPLVAAASKPESTSTPPSKSNENNVSSTTETANNTLPQSDSKDKKEETTNGTSKRNLDFQKIREILEEETNTFLKGVKNTDVDWFIRDNSVNYTIQIPPSTQTSDKKTDKPSTPDNQTTPEKKVATTNGSTKEAPPSPTLVVSPHLNTTISNTNDNYETKTKPSIGPIQEEMALPYGVTSTGDIMKSSRRRSSAISTTSTTSTSSTSSSGLFSKFKSKFHKFTALFKNDYDLRLKKKNTNASATSNISITDVSSPKRTASKSEISKAEKNAALSSSPTSHIFGTATDDDDDDDGGASDPRLDEYIKFYKQKDVRRASVSSSRAGSVDSGKYPPALVNGFEHTTYNSTPSSPPKETTSKLSSFLRRKTATIINPPSVSFKGLKPLKRVAFHSSTFLIDPPQQIPSRTPRKGNVELLPNGSYKIHPLTEEDKLAIEKSQMGLGGGIVVGGTGALGYIKKDEKDEKESEEGEGEKKEDEEHSDEDNSDEETAIDTRAKSFNIDKPMIPHQPLLKYSVPVEKMALDTMYSRCCHLREILPIPAILKQIPKSSMTPLPLLQLRNPTPTMVEIQTFADFVRIAPIICISLDGVSLSVEQFKILLSAMSAKKQLEKLSLRNTPINEQGWSLLCWFLSRNKVLNRLDITQCPSIAVNILKKKRKKSSDKKYDEEIERMTCNMDNRSDMDWSLFTATLVARGGIEELILTGCCITDIAIFEKLIKLAVSKKTSRLGLAFSQLTPRHFKILVDNWIFQHFARGLDLGFNDFSNVSMLKIILDYSKRPNFDKILANSSLSFLSLNSTNNTFTDIFKEVFETILLKLPNLKYLDLSNNQKLFGTFGKVEENTSSFQIDDTEMTKTTSISSTGSNNTNNEACIIHYFTSKFPLFPKLIRLHLENENFSQASIVAIAKVLPFCKNLGYFSILGNKVDLVAASCLVNAIKNSKTLINVDCNIELFPELFKERIGLYTMRNMERLLYATQKVPSMAQNGEKEDESLTEQLNAILALKAQQKLDLKSEQVTQFLSRVQLIRHELKETIDELLGLQLKNGLDLDGKETLIRFIFIKQSIEKGLSLIDPSLTEDDANDDAKHDNTVNLSHSDEEVSINDDLNGRHSPMRLSSRTSSRTSLNNLNKEEASVLRLSKLTQYHNLEDEEYADMSGEQLRQRMMSVELSDMDKMIGFLEMLRDKGITLEKLFKKHQAHFRSQTHDLLDLAEVRKKLKSMIEYEQGSDEQKTNKEETDDATEPVEEPIISTNEMNETYDKVLSSFTK